MDTNYNGWTNYATWRVHLDVFNGLDSYELRDNIAGLPMHSVATICRNYVDGLIYPEGRNEGELVRVRGWAAAFMLSVDWEQIAGAVMEAAGTIETA